MKNRHLNRAHIALLLILIMLNLPSNALSDQTTDPLNIAADHVEYISSESMYIAEGAVSIDLGNSSLKADHIKINNKTYDAVATGNVIYEDSDTVIKAEKIDLNLKTKLGTIYNANILYKKDNYQIESDQIEKISDKTFFLKEATITTCDTEPLAWKITGKNITLDQHKSLRAWHTKVYVRKAPVLYIPYYWLPLTQNRQSGLTNPVFGYSDERGQYYKQGIFLALSQNQDATLYIDYYSEKGIAQGLDYRYVVSPGNNGEIWFYHVKENDPSRDLMEFKSYHNIKISDNISSYLKVHAVSDYDYYDVMESTSTNRIGFESDIKDPFSVQTNERLLKYLESDLYISRPFRSGNAYLLGRYRQSIEGSSADVPQNLPEAGLILHTRSNKQFAFNMSIKGSNFIRDKGQEGRRVDIAPNFYFSFGRLFNITQRVGLRETAYDLKEPAVYHDRFTVNSDTSVTTRFFKRYSKFIHIIEPSLEYSYIPSVGQEDITAFDSTDSLEHTSNIKYALTNELRGGTLSSLNAKFRLSQGYDFLVNSRPLSPLLAEGSLSAQAVSLSLNTSYDVYTSEITDIITSIRLNAKSGYIGAGRNFRQSSLLDQATYSAGLNRPVKLGNSSIPIDIHGKLWHDLNTDLIEEGQLSTSYQAQCWGMSINYTKRPGEYQIMFMVELTGLGRLSSASMNENSSYYQ